MTLGLGFLVVGVIASHLIKLALQRGGSLVCLDVAEDEGLVCGVDHWNGHGRFEGRCGRRRTVHIVSVLGGGRDAPGERFVDGPFLLLPITDPGTPRPDER